jgi:t-SNARE complex subunit (syntaxin)
MIFEQGEKVRIVGDNIDVAKLEIGKSAKEMEEAAQIASEDGLTTKACYASIIIVFVLIIMAMILPE